MTFLGKFRFAYETYHTCILFFEKYVGTLTYRTRILEQCSSQTEWQTNSSDHITPPWWSNNSIIYHGNLSRRSRPDSLCNRHIDVCCQCTSRRRRIGTATHCKPPNHDLQCQRYSASVSRIKTIWNQKKYRVFQKKSTPLKLFRIFSFRLSLFARNLAVFLAIHIHIYLLIFVDLS